MEDPEPAFDRFDDYTPPAWDPTPGWPYLLLLAILVWAGYSYWNRPANCIEVAFGVEQTDGHGGVLTHEERACVDRAAILKARARKVIQ